jgi:hypothetical protein
MSHLVAPSVAQADKDFKITFYTYGSGCESLEHRLTVTK